MQCIRRKCCQTTEVREYEMFNHMCDDVPSSHFDQGHSVKGVCLQVLENHDTAEVMRF